MSKTTETTALAVQEQSTGYLALANPEALGIAEEMNGLEVSPEKIKIPSGGGLMFEVPGEDGEPESVKEVSGVIAYHHPVYMRYETKYTGGSNPPDCGSFDGKTGKDANGVHDCKTCRYNQFGTGENGAKACKNRQRIYILREGELFPMVLSLPTGSLKGFRQFLTVQFSKKHRNYWQYVTKVTLKKAQNNSGIVYSQAQFAQDRLLTAEEIEAVAKYAENIKAYAQTAGYDTQTDMLNVDGETGEIIEPLGN